MIINFTDFVTESLRDKLKGKNRNEIISHINNQDDFNRFYKLCFHGYLDVAKDMIKNGFDVNSQDEEGNTPLLMLCYKYLDNYAQENETTNKNILDGIYLLLDNGADVDLRSKYGDTPFNFSFQYDLYELSKIFIDYTNDINASDKHGSTVLMQACDNYDNIKYNDHFSYKYFALIRRLLRKGANPDIVSKYRKTAFDYTNDKDVVRLLKKYSKNKDINESLKDKMIGKDNRELKDAIKTIINKIYPFDRNKDMDPIFAYNLRFYLVTHNINKGYIDENDNVDKDFIKIVNEILIEKGFNKRRIKDFWKNYLYKNRQWME